MRHILRASLVIGVLAATALAQQNAEGPQRREGWGRGPGGRGGGPDGWGMRMFDQVARELDLDEEQRAKFDEITAGQRERMRGMGERWREMREAQQAGDEERVAQLREEMRGARVMDGGYAEALEKLEPILREDQVVKLWEIQDRMQRENTNREFMRAVMRDLPDELGLSEEQRGEYEELMRADRERMRGRWEEMRPLFEEMREAGEAGDEERIAELRKQMEDARPDPASMFDKFFVDLEEILTEDQIKRLADFRQRFEGGGPDAERGPADVRAVLRAARRLRLDGEQKDEIRDIERDAIREYRRLGRRDKEGQALLAAEVRDEISKLLDEQQVEQFEEQLRRSGRGGRSDREP